MEGKDKKKNQENMIIDKKDQIIMEAGEDCTKYGEFITSYFAWVPISYQKEKTEEIENMTKKEQIRDKNR